MGFKNGQFPPVDLETFLDRPLLERVKALALHWVDHGFGSPKVIPTTYVVKLVVLYLGVGLTLVTLTSDVGLPWQVGQWWNEIIVYQKLVFWTMLLETIGVAGSWGPIAGKFKPMTGGVLFWAKPATVRMPPWPGKVPFTSGDARTPLDVVLYLVLLISLAIPVVAPGAASSALASLLPDSTGTLVDPRLAIAPILLTIVLGLRDKTIFIAARAEQYGPPIVLFALVGALGNNAIVDLVVGLKLVIFSVWVCAGVSKFGAHFANVVPPMVSNSPCIPTRWARRKHYRDFPVDIRPSAAAKTIAHVLGTTVEIAVPIVLLFTTNTAIALAGALLMVTFHLFIVSTFPLAVPLEWNLLFAYGAVFLFVGFPAGQGFSVFDASPWFVAAALFCLFFFPVLGNLRPDLVAFTPSMRQYAGNWASGLWAFAPGTEDKLDQIVRPTRNQVRQLEAMGYPPVVAEITMQQTVAWRSMHSQGRGLLSLLIDNIPDIDRFTVREGEFACNSIIGFNFGDGHLHDASLIEAIQRRCNFAPGELVVAWVESQPIHRKTQSYKLIDAALGVIETGTWNVDDAVSTQPWLPDGPIPMNVTWRRRSGSAPSRHSTDAPAAPSAAPMPNTMPRRTAATAGDSTL
ncbi:putative uncharacterized protein [Rhodococcus sp. AW25M09]|uniref:DUF3556 domain-containing protein n=1 Tax=Rhodococcus sp. AW25M09 TaxID=1268303 RepID=UPI0002ACC7D1|nr:DUF3556 domain-containing protein [Rhodococcus sp. AW25M09]CCQ13596.1 putative uncharacterized protein [Rhodococcus sp. AW25M09]